MKTRADSIDDKVDRAIRESGQRKSFVIYSAYKSDADDEPIDNLNKAAVRGQCILIGRKDDFFGGRKSLDYRSPVLNKPTWLEVAVHANRMIRVTRDTHHAFLEGLQRLPKREWHGEIPEYEFVMGS